MKPFDSREQLFEYYETSTEKQWLDYIDSLTTSPSHIKNELYHISTQDDVAGVWSPRESTKEDNSKTAHPIYGEMLPTRISAAETIEGCWAGIFGHLTNNESKIKEFVVYLYKAEPLNSCKVLTPKVLSDYYLVQDAHLTGEYCLIGQVRMALISKLTLKNTFNYPDSKWINGHPYNEPRYGRTNYPPIEILKNEPITKEPNMSVDNQLEAANELSSLGIQASDLSDQPDNLKDVTKKLLSFATEFKQSVQIDMSDSNIDKQISVIKKELSNWETDSDGRCATKEQVEDALLEFQELEKSIASASTESNIDFDKTLMKFDILISNLNDKYLSLESRLQYINETGLVSESTYQDIKELGVGIESRVGGDILLTKYPSPVNATRLGSAVESVTAVLIIVKIIALIVSWLAIIGFFKKVIGAVSWLFVKKAPATVARLKEDNSKTALKDISTAKPLRDKYEKLLKENPTVLKTNQVGGWLVNKDYKSLDGAVDIYGEFLADKSVQSKLLDLEVITNPNMVDAYSTGWAALVDSTGDLLTTIISIKRDVNRGEFNPKSVLEYKDKFKPLHLKLEYIKENVKPATLEPIDVPLCVTRLDKVKNMYTADSVQRLNKYFVHLEKELMDVRNILNSKKKAGLSPEGVSTLNKMSQTIDTLVREAKLAMGVFMTHQKNILQHSTIMLEGEKHLTGLRKLLS